MNMRRISIGLSRNEIDLRRAQKVLLLHLIYLIYLIYSIE